MEDIVDISSVDPAYTGGKTQGLLGGLLSGAQESAKAVAYVVGAYQPDTMEEAQRLHTRALSDGVFTAVGLLTEGMGMAALRYAAPAARAALRPLIGATAGALGGASGAAVEGQNPLAGAVIPGLLGGALHIPGAIGEAGRFASRQADLAAQLKPIAAEAATRVPRAKAYQQMQDIHAQALQFNRLADEAKMLPQTPIAPSLEAQRAIGEFRNPLPEQQQLRLPLGETGQAELFPNEYLPPSGVRSDLAPDLTAPPVSPLPASAVAPYDLTPAGKRAYRKLALAQGRKPELIASDLRPPSPATEADKVVVDAATPEFATSTREALIKSFDDWTERTRMLPRRMPRRPGRFPRPAPGELPIDEGPPTLDNPSAAFRVAHNFAENIWDKVPEGVKANVSGFMQNASQVWDRIATSGYGAINKMGKYGIYLSNTMRGVDDKAILAAGDSIIRMRQILRPIWRNNEMLDEVGKALEYNSQNSSAMAIADQLRPLLDEVASAYSAAGGRVFDPTTGTARAFEKVRGYIPRTYSTETIEKYLTAGTKEHVHAMQTIENLNPGRYSQEQKSQILQAYFRGPREFTYGNLQISRTLNLPGYELNVRTILPKYFQRAWRATKIAEEFGPQVEKAQKAINGLLSEGFDGPLARNIFREWQAYTPKEYGSLIRGLRNFQIMTKLGFSAGFIQPAQFTNTMALVGFRHFYKGLSEVLNANTRVAAIREAEATGATLREMMQDLMPIGQGGQGPTELFTKLILLEPADKANRVVSALAGMHAAKQWALDVVANPASKAAGRLRMLGLNPEEIAGRGGQLTRAELRQAGLKVSDITQFRGGVLELPWARNTPTGQLMYLFKSFSFQQSVFVKDLILQAKRGDWAPFARYIGTLGTWGALVGHVVNTYIRPNKNLPNEPAWNWVASALQAGGLGVASDTFNAVNQGPDRLREFIMGPTFTELTDLFPEVWKTAGGDPNTFMRHMVRDIPLAGKYIVDYVVPKKE